MISTKSIASQLTDIPREWVFEHFLNLSEKLCGQDVKIKSVFNEEKKASMYIYKPMGYPYRFKDFSSGKLGDCIDLVMYITRCGSRECACHRIMTEFNLVRDKVDDYSSREQFHQEKYRVGEYTMREWTTLDKAYWMSFHIGSRMLEYYNVKPISQYRLVKEEHGELWERVVRGEYIYGYFQNDGTLYKIYQPKNKDMKFIKVKHYIQGTEQLTMKKPYLVICSSLKDIMTFNLMKYTNAEAAAADSENSMLPEHIMAIFTKSYKACCVMFDNDIAGKEAMERYKQRYKIPPVLLEMSKDHSDSVKDFGVDKVREVLTPILKQALK